MFDRIVVSTAMDAERLQTFCLDLGIRLVILFGSRAKATPTAAPGSDLDVAVLPPRDWTSGEVFRKCLAEFGEVFANYDLDLVPLNNADPLFRYEIMRDGVLLYGNVDDFLEYKAFAFRDFVDSEDLRALEEKLFQKKMAFIRHELNVAEGFSS